MTTPFNPGTAQSSGGSSSGGGWVWMPMSGTANIYQNIGPSLSFVSGTKKIDAAMGVQNAMGYYNEMSDGETLRLNKLLTKATGSARIDVGSGTYYWQQAVQAAAAQNAKNPAAKVSPWDVLNKWAKFGPGVYNPNGGGGGAGGGGPVTTNSTSTQRNVQKVSQSQAKGLLTQALQALNGRSYSASEVNDFINQFNAQAAADPQVSVSKTHTVSSRSGSTSSTSSTSSGGVDATQVATDYAKSRPDWAEYQTAVPLMNAFMQAIGNPTQGGF